MMEGTVEVFVKFCEDTLNAHDQRYLFNFFILMFTVMASRA